MRRYLESIGVVRSPGFPYWCDSFSEYLPHSSRVHRTGQSDVAVRPAGLPFAPNQRRERGYRCALRSERSRPASFEQNHPDPSDPEQRPRPRQIPPHRDTAGGTAWCLGLIWLGCIHRNSGLGYTGIRPNKDTVTGERNDPTGGRTFPLFSTVT